MPRRDTHDFFEISMTGTLTCMSEVMDAPAQLLHSHHRAIWHSPEEVCFLATLYSDTNFSFEDLFLAGIIHIQLDDAFDERQSDIRKAHRKLPQFPKLPEFGSEK